MESEQRLCDILQTGESISIDLDRHTLTRNSDGSVFQLKDPGAAAPVIDAGGLFAYARKTGMIPSSTCNRT